MFVWRSELSTNSKGVEGVKGAGMVFSFTIDQLKSLKNLCFFTLLSLFNGFFAVNLSNKSLKF